MYGEMDVLDQMVEQVREACFEAEDKLEVRRLDENTAVFTATNHDGRIFEVTLGVHELQARYWVHRMYVEQQYGGPEEGGWWYDQETPIPKDDPNYLPPLGFLSEDEAFAVCSELNQEERDRRKKENEFGYTSVLSHRDTFFSYDVTESDVARPNPAYRPHYE